MDFMNSVTYVCCTIYRVQLYYLSKRTFGGGPPYVHTTDNGVRLAFYRTSALKDKSVRPPTLAYVQSKSPIPQNALLADPSDPKSKLTLLTKLLMPS